VIERANHIPNPVRLLPPDFNRQARQPMKIIVRPDRVEEARGFGHPILQRLPQRGRIFGHSQEGWLRDTMCAVMRHCAGIDDRVGTPLGDKRRTFYGLEVKVTRVFNWLMGQALTSAAPEALRVARRFPPSCRWEIYYAGVRSPYMLQLAETFPLLALRISQQLHADTDPDRLARRDAARALVEGGARLREVAAVYDWPMALRQVKAGAVHLSFGLLCEQPRLLERMPEPLPQMRRWLRRLRHAHNIGGRDYATWAARHDLGAQEIEDLGDWIKACQHQRDAMLDQEIQGWIEQGNVPPHLEGRLRARLGVDRLFNRPVEGVDRPFVATMSLATVRKLSADWHEAMAKKEEANAQPFPEPWFPASPLLNGYEIVPITNSGDLYREGKAMRHCVGSYSYQVINGSRYIYSIREGDKRIATVEIARDQDNRPALGQVRGPCNAPAPKEVVTAARRWLRSRKNELPAALTQIVGGEAIPF
jgi:hypothetical protein